MSARPNNVPQIAYLIVSFPRILCSWNLFGLMPSRNAMANIDHGISCWSVLECCSLSTTFFCRVIGPVFLTA
jgi:hypothetical protein